MTDDVALAAAVGSDEAGVARLRGALGPRSNEILNNMLAHDCDLFVRLLDGSFREYQRPATRWWNAIAPQRADRPADLFRVVEQSLARESHRRLRAPAPRGDRRVPAPAQISKISRRATTKRSPTTTTRIATNILYYSLRAFIHEPGTDASRMDAVQASDRLAGLHAIVSPGKIDVDAQIIDLGKLDPEHLDPRVHVAGIERLARSNAVIINIDYPLGMAAYHHLSAIWLGVDELRGMYIMGKAATLNGRVGDVMISKVVHDEHSANTYLFRNAFDGLRRRSRIMHHGTVLDNQKALTVRSAFLQNREYMDVFYREGYTVMEMEAGPYLVGWLRDRRAASATPRTRWCLSSRRPGSSSA